MFQKNGMYVVAETGRRDHHLTQFWQVVSCFVASLSCISFGLMVGWPCPIYPTILQANDNPGIMITWPQSALIAGCLMLGNTLGAPVSSREFISSKYGILIGTVVMLIGSCLMFLAGNMYWFMGSRFLGGLGHSFCFGQLRRYIGQVCEGDLKLIMIKQMNLHHFFGIIAIVSYGSFLDFKTTGLVSTIITTIILIILLFLPSATETKRKTMKIEKSCNVCPDFIKTPLFEILRNNDLRKKFMLFLTLVICQQYSGMPATIVYCQIIFGKFHFETAKLFSIAYMVTYFFVNILGIFVTPKYNKRFVLLLSSFGVSLVLIVSVAFFVANINQLHCTYIFHIVIFVYMIIHTLGMGNIPFTLISDFFPNKYRNTVTIFFIMLHSMLALTITKIVQVIITLQYHVTIPFCLFCSFSSVAFIISYFALENKNERKTVCEISLTKK